MRCTYVKENLVYEKSSGNDDLAIHKLASYNIILIHLGSIIGFTDLGEINAHLSAFEQQLENGTTIQEPPLAKTMLVLMVSDLFNGLQFPYAQFACLRVTAV